MEKLMQRENVNLGGNAEEEWDFNDVFGGPPTRFSMQEVRARYSFGGEVSSLKDKPVFGEESSTPRRRNTKGSDGDFFDDIFKGSRESSYSSPRRTPQDIRDRDRDNSSLFGSSPADSRIMSPARPLPPKADDDHPLLAQLSLPAKMTKAMELPTFASHKADGNTINGLNSPHSSSPLSRFSNRCQDEIRNEFHRRSPLSYEASFITTEDSTPTVTFHQKDNIENFKKDTRNVDSDGNQFHFSIYKWAGRGVPMLMPLISGNNFRSKDKSKKYHRYPSYNGRIDDSKSSLVSRKEQLEEDFSRKEETKEMQNSVAKALSEFRELKPRRNPNDIVALSSGRQTVKDEPVKSPDESNAGEETQKEATVSLLKSDVKKPLHAFLDKGELQQRPEMEDKKTRTSGVHADHAHNTENVEENEGAGVLDSKNAKVQKSSLRGVAINLGGVSQGKSIAKGKVKEFVQIFNQEPADLQASWSSRWRNISIEQKENEENAAKAREQVNLHNVDKKADVSFIKVDEKLNINDEAQKCSPVKTPSYTSNYYSSSSDPQKTFSSETLHSDSKSSPEEIPDDPLEDNFMVQELSDDHENDTQRESSEDTKVIDAKIQQWSFGKKGNIRSLLSTLQYVLWPESGWKPLPLVDLIESNSVKRAYQKALLRLHPDKLQQKGAAFHQKYIAEKVFDILQEAWDHFILAPL